MRDMLLTSFDAQEMIYHHFLQSKEKKKIESGKQSKVLPAINGA